MYNKRIADSVPPENRVVPPPAGERKVPQPPQRPTINTAVARSASPVFSYAAVAAGSRSPSTASATNTTGSGFYTSATSITPLTAFSQPASGVSQHDFIAQKPSRETPFAKKTGLSPHASTFVMQNTGGPTIEMPGVTRPKSPRGSGLQFGSFPRDDAPAVNEAAEHSHEMLVASQKQQRNAAFSNAAHQSYKQRFANTWAGSAGRNDKVTPGMPSLARQPFNMTGAMGDVPPMPHPESVMVYSAATPNHTNMPSQQNTTPGDCRSGGSDECLTNPYDSGERQKQKVTPTGIRDNESVGSAFSTLTPNAKLQTQDSSPGLWEERTHKESFRTVARQHSSSVVEAVVNGKRFIEGLNPPTFKMNVGARALCIKTDHVRNIYASLRHMVWATPEKIGVRINRVWEARGSNQDDVILLFSINGQKCYCGMAIMRGVWKANEVPGDFEATAKEKALEGSLPVEWKFLKNVSYDHFAGITHPGHNQPIVNMWNGMHFPHEQGRQVIKKYVQTTHFTNVMVYRGDQQYNPFKDIRHGAQLDPTLRDKFTRPMAFNPSGRGRGAIRGDRQGQPVPRLPMAPPHPGQGVVLQNHPHGGRPNRGGKPTAAIRNQAPFGTVNNNASAHISVERAPQGIRPGTLFVADEQGALVPFVPPAAPTATAFGVSHQGSRASTPQLPHVPYMLPQQPAPVPNGSRGLGAGLDAYSFGDGFSSGLYGGTSHHFVNVGNNRMQSRGDETSSIHIADPFHNSAVNYTQGPPIFGITPTGQNMASGNGIAAAQLTRENLRAMQSMSNIHSGPSAAQNMARHDRVLRHIASASQMMMPLSGTPAPYTPGSSEEMRPPPTDQTASPLTTIPRTESEAPARQRHIDASQREYIHTIGRVVGEMMRRFPLEDGEGMDVGGLDEDEETFSDKEEGGVRLW